MGLTYSDAQQVGKMYGCQAESFRTCPQSSSICVTNDCTCHQEFPQGQPLGRTLIKLTDSNGCKRCQRRCPDATRGRADPECGCPTGYERDSFTQSGRRYFFCKVKVTKPEPVPVEKAQCYGGWRFGDGTG